MKCVLFLKTGIDFDVFQSLNTFLIHAETLFSVLQALPGAFWELG